MKKEEKKPTNFGVAVYVANKYGSNVPEDKLRKVAEMYNFKYKTFLENYKFICMINEMFKDD